ncbi:hypothetical protein FACS1894132_05330 [Clostridia bacterium]|nr:hypothetical protein FACS1894132_05330 [Clostridia bacterium]
MKKAGIGFSLSVIFILLFFMASPVGKEFELIQYAVFGIQGACAIATAICLTAAMSSLANYFENINEQSDNKNILYGESWNTKVTTFMNEMIKSNDDFTRKVNESVSSSVEAQQKAATDLSENVNRFVKETNKTVSNFYDNNMLELQKVSDNQERSMQTLIENQNKLQGSLQDVTKKINETIEFVGKNNTQFFDAFVEMNKKTQEAFEEKELKWKSDMQFTIVQAHQAFTTSANDSHVRLISVVESLTKLFDSYIEEFELKICENLSSTTSKTVELFEQGTERLNTENVKVNENLALHYNTYLKTISDSVEEVRLLIGTLGDIQERVLIGLDEKQRELEQMNRADISLLKEILSTE